MINPLNCREVTTRLALGDLAQYAVQDRWMIHFHLFICWVCRKYEKQINVIRQAFRLSIKHQRQNEDLSDFQERLVERLRKIQ